ncbi:lipopolysaccharide assembly protein LapB [Ectothiorhodospira variabilis]|uniref:lipopolysaccharide assembly protein LapB n=1 Tax=Ectothiorhodospira variabilis TaxID=505694 RepID=UPI001EFB8641|nr:lipopolysaccharide assembly protein LapB [Ectothiorhodospira variabilis]MCG5495070.1 lipopolysaccharide assembly protein LapB [Ectothiorhodospira variabilis]MCG5498611.1 lipopolysaccharide assembly protein LapB [Ectothiorhodospira variabilis]MCG5504657.1 lipopolysaccharide assembly protein LapB [Ectothiorhodospira variabilis]MCG5507790.1 lipopolysaccharide assembly protein LapB [Ectothiorhodospira variabilis]
MLELLWLLLPVAAASGWLAARRAQQGSEAPGRGAAFSSEYIQGLNYLLSEQSDRALEVFIDMVEVDPETVETHLILGSLFRRRGEVDRAIRIHQNLMERPGLEPAQRANALMELGRDYMKAGVLDQAEHLFKELVELGYLQADAYKRLRSLYEQEKDWSQAIWASEQLCEFSSEPQNQRIAHYHCELGEMARGRGDREEAGRCARRALSFDQHCARASILMGDLAREENHPHLAIEHYSRVMRQDAGFVTLVLEQAREAFQTLGDTAGYENFLQSVRENDASVSSALALARLLHDKGQREPLDQLLTEEMGRDRVPLRLVKEYLLIMSARGEAADVDALDKVARALGAFLKERPQFGCVRCGFQSRNHFWHCPSCHAWGSIRPLERPQVARPETSLTPPAGS